jgi:hypothetical protein
MRSVEKPLAWVVALGAFFLAEFAVFSVFAEAFRGYLSMEVPVPNFAAALLLCCLVGWWTPLVICDLMRPPGAGATSR